MIDSAMAMSPATGFEVHGARGRFNAAFFSLMEPYIEWNLRTHKRRLFGELPQRSSSSAPEWAPTSATCPPGPRSSPSNPTPTCTDDCGPPPSAAGVHLELHDRVAERTDLPDHCVDSVISSLVLCSVTNPAEVLAEIRRILRPGGTYRFVEHVAAPAGTPTRAVQRALRRPWAWTFEGCSCERDLESLIRAAGFARVDIEAYRLHTPFVPFNTHIAGTAYA